MTRRRVLVIAPHADDETLSMGGTIAKKMDNGEDVTVAILTGHGSEPNPIGPKSGWDTVRKEAKEALLHLGQPKLEFFELPAVTLSEHPVYKINRTVAELVQRIDPNEIYLPFYNDLHNDHRLLCYAGLVATRAYLPTSQNIELVAMYETPTETHLMPPATHAPFAPTLYVSTTGYMDCKLAAWSCYESQHQSGTTPRTPSSLKALATLRGSEIGVESAEAFTVIRSVVH